MSTNTAQVAERVRHVMQTAGVSEKALATETGIARATLQRRLTGNTSFTVTELVAIATSLEVDIAALLSAPAEPVEQVAS